MRAAIASRYGPPDVLRVMDVPTPSPKPGEVRIRICAATVTAGDCEVRSFRIPPLFWLPARLLIGVRRPRKGVLGQEFSGVIDALGEGVTKRAIGEEVFGPTTITGGAYGEYLCLKESHALGKKPANRTHEQAATLTVGGMNAIWFLEKAKLARGERLLINGAGGSIGTYALQYAKHLGAHVSCVDDPRKFAMLRGSGADALLDYRTQDFTTLSETYDVIFDIVGNLQFRRCERALNARGRLVIAHLRVKDLVLGAWLRWRGGKQLICGIVKESPQLLERLSQLAHAGTLRAIIDRTYPLEAIREAHEYVETGAKAGHVVVHVSPTNS